MNASAKVVSFTVETSQGLGGERSYLTIQFSNGRRFRTTRIFGKHEQDDLLIVMKGAQYLQIRAIQQTGEWQEIRRPSWR